MTYIPQHPVEVLALIVALVVGVLILATSSPGRDSGEGRPGDSAPGGDYLPSVLSQPGPRGDAGWILAALVAVLLLGAAAAWLAANKYI